MSNLDKAKSIFRGLCYMIGLLAIPALMILAVVGLIGRCDDALEENRIYSEKVWENVGKTYVIHNDTLDVVGSEDGNYTLSNGIKFSHEYIFKQTPINNY